MTATVESIPLITASILLKIRAYEDAELLARGMIEIGGGRRVKGAEIDRAVGFELARRPGEEVAAGDPWCVVHARTEEEAAAAVERLSALAVWSEEPVDLSPVVTGRISEGR